ncbi:hypothetical protein D3C75_688360 [compost metagenome]
MNHNVFISHAWEYTEHYNIIVQWLNEAQSKCEFNWKNYSVLEDDGLIDQNALISKKKLKEMIDEQIKPASIVIILSEMYETHSEWIDYEIDTAVSYSKYIIGVKPWGQGRVPTKIQNNADVIIGIKALL